MQNQATIPDIQLRLLDWYARHRRDLPWRRTDDPYAVWISEIMLQQTQVAAVIPYYLRFMERFPDVSALAKAHLDEVIKVWEGLGYYSRARNLHRAAQTIVSEYNGRLPQSAGQLLALPGIGRYTAGAIASIAFGLDEPVLDGNVERVLCRIFRIRQNPKETKTHHKLWTLARQLVPSSRAGFFNQAMMDLGATVCIPRNPRCSACPIQVHCQAHHRQEQDRIPLKSKRKPLPHDDIAAAIIRKRDKILIDRRKHDGLLGGLWEFPGGKREPEESLEACLVREVREELDIEIKVLEPFMSVKHTYTHFRITLHTFHCRHLSGRPRPIECSAVKWVTLDELRQYAFPRANRKIIDRLLADD